MPVVSGALNLANKGANLAVSGVKGVWNSIFGRYMKISKKHH